MINPLTLVTGGRMSVLVFLIMGLACFTIGIPNGHAAASPAEAKMTTGQLDLSDKDDYDFSGGLTPAPADRYLENWVVGIIDVAGTFAVWMHNAGAKIGYEYLKPVPRIFITILHVGLSVALLAGYGVIGLILITGDTEGR